MDFDARLGIWSSRPRDARCDMNTARVRKNVRNLSTDEMNRYVNAVRQLNSGPKPSRWDLYANNHVEYFGNIHGNPWFLAWHRLMLYFIERELQAIDPSVTIPYWDWTTFSQNPREDKVLSNQMFGTTGDVNTGCVRDGYFSDFKVFYWGSGQQSEHCLIRSLEIFQRQFTSAAAIDQNYLNEPTIARFAEAIEGVPHSTTHNNIGGEFSGHASPGDPLFYSHHAFVDKLWFDWQNRHRNNFYSYPLDLSFNVPPWNLNIGQAVDPIGSLCYYYPMDHFSYTPQPAPSSFMAQEVYAPPSNATDDELMAHAKKFILKGLNSTQATLEPLPIVFIRKMGYDQVKIRTLERRDALVMAKKGTVLTLKR